MLVQKWVSGRFALRSFGATLIVGGAGHPAQAAKDQPTLAAGECAAIEGFAVLATPSAPWKGAPLRVIDWRKADCRAILSYMRQMVRSRRGRRAAVVGRRTSGWRMSRSRLPEPDKQN